MGQIWIVYGNITIYSMNHLYYIEAMPLIIFTGTGFSTLRSCLSKIQRRPRSRPRSSQDIQCENEWAAHGPKTVVLLQELPDQTSQSSTMLSFKTAVFNLDTLCDKSSQATSVNDQKYVVLWCIGEGASTKPKWCQQVHMCIHLSHIMKLYLSRVRSDTKKMQQTSSADRALFHIFWHFNVLSTHLKSITNHYRSHQDHQSRLGKIGKIERRFQPPNKVCGCVWKW